jgi:hypothetical protein
LQTLANDFSDGPYTLELYFVLLEPISGGIAEAKDLKIKGADTPMLIARIGVKVTPLALYAYANPPPIKGVIKNFRTNSTSVKVSGLSRRGVFESSTNWNKFVPNPPKIAKANIDISLMFPSLLNYLRFPMRN